MAELNNDALRMIQDQTGFEVVPPADEDPTIKNLKLDKVPFWQALAWVGELLTHIRERDIRVTAGSERAADAIRTLLTERELEIFKRLASGDSNHEIGRAFSLSENTVKNHVASILAKLHLDNRIQAAVQAVRCGFSCLVGALALQALTGEGDLHPGAVIGLLLGI